MALHDLKTKQGKTNENKSLAAIPPTQNTHEKKTKARQQEYNKISSKKNPTNKRNKMPLILTQVQLDFSFARDYLHGTGHDLKRQRSGEIENNQLDFNNSIE